MTVLFNRSPKGKRAAYRISADRDGVQLSVDAHFWNNAIIDHEGTTQLDDNIATVVQEIRAALYYIGTDSIPHA